MNELVIAPDLKQLLSADEAHHYGILPLSKNDEVLEFATSKGVSDSTKKELEYIFEHPISFTILDDEILAKSLVLNYPLNRNRNQKSLQITDDFLDQILVQASELEASDIHIEIFESKSRVRFRVDGKLREQFVIDRKDYPGLVNKIKIRANLDISEKRLPQDGRIKLGDHFEQLELRVSVLPTLRGEKIVLRLLSNDSSAISLSSTGFSDTQFRQINEAIKNPNGIILVSGPTGSGKTTTLYALLKELNTTDRNITTIENPVEYTLEGINQIQVNEAIGFTFASALRSILRQDPDVIMLGEIRDKETAELAVRAALTGHLVLSTIHTNSAWGIINRLVDMGVKDYLLESTMKLAAAQRLIRVLCEHCKTLSCQNNDNDYQIKYPSLPKNITEFYEPKGCSRCNYSGFKGVPCHSP